jgi:hypothetical protein
VTDVGAALARQGALGAVVAALRADLVGAGSAATFIKRLTGAAAALAGAAAAGGGAAVAGGSGGAAVAAGVAAVVPLVLLPLLVLSTLLLAQ